MEDGSLVNLVPVRPSNLRIVEFDYDVSEFLGARTIADCPEVPTMRGSYVVVFGGTPTTRGSRYWSMRRLRAHWSSVTAHEPSRKFSRSSKASDRLHWKVIVSIGSKCSFNPAC